MAKFNLALCISYGNTAGSCTCSAISCSGADDKVPGSSTSTGLSDVSTQLQSFSTFSCGVDCELVAYNNLIWNTGRERINNMKIVKIWIWV